MKMLLTGSIQSKMQKDIPERHSMKNMQMEI